MLEPKAQGTTMEAIVTSAQGTQNGNTMTEAKPRKAISEAQDITELLEILGRMAKEGKKIVKPQVGEDPSKTYDPAVIADGIRLMADIVKGFIKEGRSLNEISETLQTGPTLLQSITNEQGLRDKASEVLRKLVTLPHHEKQFEAVGEFDPEINAVSERIGELEQKKLRLEKEIEALQKATTPLRKKNEQLEAEIQQKQIKLEQKNKEIEEREERSKAHHARMMKKFSELLARIKQLGKK